MVCVARVRARCMSGDTQVAVKDAIGVRTTLDLTPPSITMAPLPMIARASLSRAVDDRSGSARGRSVASLCGGSCGLRGRLLRDP